MSCLGVNTPRRDCVGLLALLIGLRLFFLHFAGVARALRARLTPAYVISPLKGLLNSAGGSPRGTIIFTARRNAPRMIARVARMIVLHDSGA